MYINRAKVQDDKLDEEFTEKFSEFWADLDTENLTKVQFYNFSKVIKMSYVFIIMSFQDGPMI